MRDALLSSDQELYFRLLSAGHVLLPVAPNPSGRASAVGWGTWTQGDRTHLLAFTSPQALYACLPNHRGSFRQLGFGELADEWPNHDWWPAVNPGLPIESYLPAWFVTQLTRGDVRLPGRSLGARARMVQSDLARAAAARTGVISIPSRADRPPDTAAAVGTPVGTPVGLQTPPPIRATVVPQSIRSTAPVSPLPQPDQSRQAPVPPPPPPAPLPPPPAPLPPPPA